MDAVGSFTRKMHSRERETIGAVFRTLKSIQGPCTNMIFLDFRLRMRNFLC